jgi:medium-chain acyl-[acyl-carrier-protein] hydrolase
MSVLSSENPWFGRSLNNADGRLLLLCFPPVGGGSMFFRSWLNSRLQEIAICPIQLPGREHRMMERPFERMQPLVQKLLEVIPQERPFAFFGHSMGALISFEVARGLRKQGLPGLQRMFVSAASAPHLPRKPPRYSLPDPEFVEALRVLGGTSDMALNDVELLRDFLPMLRADFAVVDTYEYLQEEPLDCPIHVFGGKEDREVPCEQLLSWRTQTRAEFTSRIFPGGHSYIQTALGKLIEDISNTTRRYGG